MKLSEFMKRSWQAGRYKEVAWWIRVFTDFVESPNAAPVTEPYYLVKQPWGLGVMMPDKSIEKIDDYPGKGPAFDAKFPLTIDQEWVPNINVPTETTLGILLANTLLISESFGKKIPYINKEVTIDAIEAIVAPRLTSDPKPGEQPSDSPQVIHVFEYMSMNKGIEVIVSIMELFTVALTRKTLLPPPGIKEYRAKLLAEGNYNLDDPIQLADFEAKLLKYDAEYLKGDPSFGKFASGKILKDARKKLFLSMGAEGGFSKDGTIVGISRSLSEGQPRNPREFVAAINGSRSGSFSRGHETMEGGVAAKKMLAASNNYVITKDDCGSTMGLERTYHPWLVKSLRGRTIINGKTQEKVDINADTSQYLGKKIRTRSPMYCRKPGEQICSVCAGDAMARYGTGIAIPLTEISHAILTARMKAMHTNALTVNNFSIEELFT